MKKNKPRRWLRGVPLTLLARTSLAIAAHRPLLRVAVEWAGRQYAAGKGYTLDRKVSFNPDRQRGEPIGTVHVTFGLAF